MGFIVKRVCLGMGEDHTYAEVHCHTVCHIGRSSEQTGNTVTSVFPTCVSAETER